jgi:spoIIIJ-associated protein
MTNDVNSIEVSARSLDAAVRQALEHLGAQEDEVIIEIIASPRTGLLGLGARPARVRVTRRSYHAAVGEQGLAKAASGVGGEAAATPERSVARAEKEPGGGEKSRPGAGSRSTARKLDLFTSGESAGAQSADTVAAGLTSTSPDSTAAEVAGYGPAETATKPTKALEEQQREAVAVLKEILSLMGEQVRTSAAEVDTEAGEHAAIEINLEGESTALLIGRRGQTLEALEYVVNRILARRTENPAPVLLDVESYHARRNQRLARTALALGEQVKRQRKAVRLKPMPPRERRVIHMTLRDDPLLITESAGSGYLRAVKILPAAQAGQQPSPARGRS